MLEPMPTDAFAANFWQIIATAIPTKLSAITIAP